MDRQRIIETNRSLRIIKNELETLLEKGILNDNAYESITNLLPAESSLSSASVPTLASQRHNQSLHQPSLPIRKASPAAEPVAHPPPAYSQTQSAAVAVATATAAAAAPIPSLPPRKNTQPEAPEKPVLCKARALYKYAAQDSRDCSFDKEDVIHVYEYMNADWWMGRNERTGTEGIFPRNYVEQIPDHDEKAGGSAVAASGYPAPPPPGAHNPYNSDAPPMAVADGGKEGDGKGQEMGKKFGKKLGNAAIFGAGATMGSKIVSSIF